MKHTVSLPILMALSGLIFSSPADALSDQATDTSGKSISHHATEKTETSIAQEAHAHGKAELFIVLEGKQLEIELHSPAINLLGFEHHASSPEQRAKVESTKSTLANANILFQINSAACQLIDHEVDLSSVVGTHNKHQDTESHSDIEAHYRYHCERPHQVDSLRTTLSDQFPGVESLQVQWVVNDRQGTATLDNGLIRLHFK